jgi:hypothetical protein
MKHTTAKRKRCLGMPCDFCFRAVTLDGDTRLDILLQTSPR